MEISKSFLEYLVSPPRLYFHSRSILSFIGLCSISDCILLQKNAGSLGKERWLTKRLEIEPSIGLPCGNNLVVKTFYMSPTHEMFVRDGVWCCE